MRRFLLIALLPLLAVVVAALLAAAWLLLTPAGASLVIGAVEDRLPLTVTDVEGSLVTRLCASSVEFRQPGLEVRATDLCVDVDLWSSVDFLKVDLGSVDAGEVIIRIAPAGGPAGDTGIRLPVPIEIGHLGVRRARVNDVELAAISSEIALSNRNFRTVSSFVFQDRQFRLQTGGPLTALTLDVQTVDFAARGRVNTVAARLPYSFTVTSDRLSLEEWIDRAVVVESTTLTADGDLDRYRFTLTGRAIDPLVRVEAVSAEGTGTVQGLRFTAGIRGLEAVDDQLSVADGSVSGSLDWETGFRVSLENHIRAGAVRSVPVSGQVRLDVVQGTTTIDKGVFQLAAPYSGELELSGVVGADGVLDLQVDAEEVPLTLLREGIGGDVSGRTTIRGTPAGPQFAGSFRLREPGWSAVGAQTAIVQFDGSLEGGSVVAELSGEAWNAASRFTFTRRGDTVDVDVRSLSATLAETASGPVAATLQQPATVVVSGDGVRSDEACFGVTSGALDMEPATLCGAFRYPEGPLRLSLSRLVVDGYELVSGELRLGGYVEAEASLDGFAPLAGELSVTLGNLVAVNDNDVSLALGDLVVQGVLGDDSIALTIGTAPEQALQVDGRGRVVLADELADSALDGTATLSLDGIWVAESLLPMDVTYELDRLRGTLHLAADVDGTVSHPVVSGRASVEHGGWLVQASNTEFSDIELDARLFESTRLALEGGGRVGAGSLAIKGELDLGDAPLFTSTVSLQDALAVDLPDYSARLSGTVDFGMAPDAMTISGNLTMPRATIRLSELPETAVSVSADEKVVGEAPPTQQHRTTTIQLELGDRVRFVAFGLDTRLKGRLKLRERPGIPPELTGTVDLVEGRFEAYGQELTIDRGRLIFSGAMDNPEVDVAASRLVDNGDREVRVTLYLSGTAQSLTTTVASDPALPESDALALLITGRTFSEMTDSEQSNMYGAAISLGLLGARRLTEPVGSNLGLDEIILDQDDDGGVRVGAAIRINRDLYFRYTYGAFSRLGGALLRYRLSDRISLQAQTGDTQSIEIRYGVD